ncbi:MAG: exodeoxyribonuclease III [Saprospiraceae bacterium]|nr:exodeoxyribonuclease III [Saprospiraceae bacterium]
MKLISWNVNGIRASVRKDFVKKYEEMDADVFCIQETKAQDDQVKEALEGVDNAHIYTTSAEKKGYSGVCTICKEEPVSVSEGIGEDKHDGEGRVLKTEFETFQLVNVYVPNSGAGLKRLDYRAEWDKAFAEYLREQDKIKPVIVAGDFNVAHEAIDLARPKQNYNKTSGYTQIEIDGMDGLLEAGFFDSWREQHPDKVKYTFWSMRFGAREKNIGWRIDYFLVSNTIKDRVGSTSIHNDVMGSDHCPIGLQLEN